VLFGDCCARVSAVSEGYRRHDLDTPTEHWLGRPDDISNWFSSAERNCLPAVRLSGRFFADYAEIGKIHVAARSHSWNMVWLSRPDDIPNWFSPAERNCLPAVRLNVRFFADYAEIGKIHGAAKSHSWDTV